MIEYDYFVNSDDVDLQKIHKHIQEIKPIENKRCDIHIYYTAAKV